MRSLRRPLALLALCGFLFAQQEKPVDMADDPTHTLLLENAAMRAFAVAIPRLGESKLHRHDRDYIVISLTDGEVSHHIPGTHPVEQPQQTEDVNYVHRQPFAHTMRNEEITTYRNLTVEIMQRDQSAYSGFLTDDAVTWWLPWGVDHSKPFVVSVEKTGLTMVRVQLLEEGTVRRPGRGGGTLLVALTDLELAPDGADEPLKMSKGDVKWLDGGAVFFKNATRDPARFVLLEFRK